MKIIQFLTLVGLASTIPLGQASRLDCVAGQLEVSVEGVGTFCATVPICVGGMPNGNCPGPQEGLPHGSSCGIVRSGVPGCVLKSGGPASSEISSSIIPPSGIGAESSSPEISLESSSSPETPDVPSTRDGGSAYPEESIPGSGGGGSTPVPVPVPHNSAPTPSSSGNNLRPGSSNPIKVPDADDVTDDGKIMPPSPMVIALAPTPLPSSSTGVEAVVPWVPGTAEKEAAQSPPNWDQLAPIGGQINSPGPQEDTGAQRPTYENLSPPAAPSPAPGTNSDNGRSSPPAQPSSAPGTNSGNGHASPPAPPSPAPDTISGDGYSSPAAAPSPAPGTNSGNGRSSPPEAPTPTPGTNSGNARSSPSEAPTPTPGTNSGNARSSPPEAPTPTPGTNSGGNGHSSHPAPPSPAPGAISGDGYSPPAAPPSPAPGTNSGNGHSSPPEAPTPTPGSNIGDGQPSPPKAPTPIYEAGETVTGTSPPLVEDCEEEDEAELQQAQVDSDEDYENEQDEDCENEQDEETEDRENQQDEETEDCEDDEKVEEETEDCDDSEDEEAEDCDDEEESQVSSQGLGLRSSDTLVSTLAHPNQPARDAAGAAATMTANQGVNSLLKSPAEAKAFRGPSMNNGENGIQKSTTAGIQGVSDTLTSTSGHASSHDGY